MFKCTLLLILLTYFGHSGDHPEGVISQNTCSTPVITQEIHEKILPSFSTQSNKHRTTTTLFYHVIDNIYTQHHYFTVGVTCLGHFQWPSSGNKYYPQNTRMYVIMSSFLCKLANHDSILPLFKTGFIKT
jgi:hypothetical protein